VAAADIGIQIGSASSASEVTRGAAHVVLLSGLQGVPFLLDISTVSFRRMVFNFVWSGVYNVSAILLASGALVKVRVPPAYAGLGELVSVLPRRFELYRHVDVSGVSGTGVVAYGCLYPNGIATLCWNSPHPAVSIWQSLADMLAGVAPDQALQAEYRRGTLPPGRLGWRAGMEIRDSAKHLASAALTHRQAQPVAFDVDVDLGAGRRLTGTVPSVFSRRLISVSYSRLGAKHLLATWVQLLALCADDDDHNWTGLVIGRRQRGTEPATRLFGPVGPEARELLADLVAVYDAGRREPLPLPLKTSFAWYEARRTNGDPVTAARRRWKPASYEGENADPAHVRVWGANTPLEVLLKPAGADEMRPGETTRLGAYAARVWGPMLDHEREAP
jgi:hypothetical protein